MKAKRTLPLIALGVYMLLLIWLVIFKLEFDPANLYSYRQLILIPYSRPGAINMRVVAEEIILNVLAFVPLGLLLSAVGFPKKAWARVLAGFGLSLVFEIAQYVFAIGTSDVTDLINNTLGTALGVLLWLPLKKLFKEKAEPAVSIAVLALLALALSAYLFLSLANI